MANEQNQNESGEYQIDEIAYAKRGLMLMDFEKQLCHCTCLREINYLKEKYHKCSAAPLMPSIVFCILL